MCKATLPFAIILFAFSCLHAQTGAIKGKVTDKYNNTLSGANVIVKGTFIGTTTDARGAFNIKNIPTGAIFLDVSYMGYQSVSVSAQINAETVSVVDVALSPSVLALGEVTVSSTRYEKQMKDVPLPIGIVQKSEIDVRMPSDVSTALNTVPGVFMGRDGVWGSQVNIRGLGKQNIVLLVDGSRIETATNIAAGLSLVDIHDIDRIEVVKGAASSLYGSGALGGVVNIHTRSGRYRDTFGVDGSLLTGYGTVNRGANGNLAFNTGASHWFVKFSGTTRHAENTETPEGTLQNSQFTDNNISIQTGLKPRNNHELLVKYQRFYAQDVGIPGGAPFPLPAKATYPKEKREMVSAEYHIQNMLPAMANFSIKYSNQLIERRVKLVPNATTVIRPNGDHLVNSLHIQTDWTPGQNQYLVLGLDAWQRDFTSWRTKEISFQNLIIREIPVPKSEYRSIGLYVQDEIKLLRDRLNLTAGARIDQIQVTNEESRNPEYIISNGIKNESPPNQTLLWNAGTTDDLSYSASLGLLYKLTHHFDLSLNAARSFRSPSLEERFQYIQLGAATYLGDPNLEPENGSFFDIGLRLRSSRLSITGNAFVNFINNKVIDDFQSENLYVKTNVGEARLFGFDVALDYNILGALVLYSSAAYVRGEDTGNDLDLPEIPPLNGQVGLRSPLLKYFNVDVSANMAAGQTRVAAGEIETPGYTYFNLYLQTNPISVSGLSNRLIVGIENIFDRAYRYHLSTYRGLVRLEPGRNVLVRWMLYF
jgi:hemoglobin/transferrin/lactoferrin receptor protein